MDLQVILNTYATDIFRKQADYDYISARMNYRLKLRQQFLWSGQQAIEKYLKAILLFNGKSARYYLTPDTSMKKEFGHNLDALHSEVGKLSYLGYNLDGEDKRFLSFLSKLGGSNRYMSTSSYNTRDAIQRLDRLVWSVRRYCQYIADRGLGCGDAVPGMREAVIRSINSPKHLERPVDFSLFNGELEKVLKRDPRDLTRQALVWANLYYGRKQRSKVTYRSFSSSEVPPQERKWPNIDWKRLEEYVKP